MKRDPIITGKQGQKKDTDSKSIPNVCIFLLFYIVYEANANPADHKIPGAESKMDHSIQ